jgi:hypothetical protein
MLWSLAEAKMENLEELAKALNTLSNKVKFLEKEVRKNELLTKSLEKEIKYVGFLRNAFYTLGKRVDKIFSRVSALNTTDSFAERRKKE